MASKVPCLPTPARSAHSAPGQFRRRRRTHGSRKRSTAGAWTTGCWPSERGGRRTPRHSRKNAGVAAEDSTIGDVARGTGMVLVMIMNGWSWSATHRISTHQADMLSSRATQRRVFVKSQEGLHQTRNRFGGLGTLSLIGKSSNELKCCLVSEVLVLYSKWIDRRRRGVVEWLKTYQGRAIYSHATPGDWAFYFYIPS